MMIVGKKTKTPIWNGKNYTEIINSFPFYITRDDQGSIDESNFYSIQNRKGKPSICAGQCKETKDIHFFTNIGVINCKVGECIEFMEIE